MAQKKRERQLDVLRAELHNPTMQLLRHFFKNNSSAAISRDTDITAFS